jgi:cytochrome c oxidase subunit 1
MSFAGNPLGHEFPGTAWLMMALTAIFGLAAIVGGAMYLLITVGSVFFGKKIATPGFAYVKVKDGMAPPPVWQPVGAAITGHGSSIGTAGFVAPGTFLLALVFLVAFVLYYFVNWKYLSTVWPLS